MSVRPRPLRISARLLRRPKELRPLVAVAAACMAVVVSERDAVATEAARSDAPERLSRRSVELVMKATLAEIPEGARVVDLWMPVARDTDGQSVDAVRATPEGAFAVEPRYGNRVWHRRFEGPFASGTVLEVEIAQEIRRTEIVVEAAKGAAGDMPLGGEESVGAGGGPILAPTAAAPYLEPNLLVPSGLPRIDDVARSLGLAEKPPLVAARAIYDWLIDEFEYDWKAPGAGRGDLAWACDAKTGDCSDYHTVFLALCRLRGIPADHEFGFPIRTRNPEGRLPYHHCWARFHVDGIGWIPVDASEADKHPELREYNFGSQGADLMKFTSGRDVVLEPPQQGPPLNKFIHPYAEIDGAPVEKVKFETRFRDLP